MYRCSFPAAATAAILLLVSQAPVRSAPAIACDQPLKDFGVVNNNTQLLVHAFTVWNRGDSDLQIQAVHSSCGCTAVDAGDRIVKPGGSTSIKARFTIRGRNKGVQEKDIRVTTNDPFTPQLVLKLKCEIRLDIDTDVSGFFFDRAPATSQTLSRTVFLRAASNVTFNVTSMDTSASACATFAVETVETGRLYSITATVGLDNLPQGFTQERVTVCTDRPGFERIDLPVSLCKVEEVMVIPTELPLPANVLRQPVILRDFYLYIKGTNRWEFFDVEPAGDFKVTVEERVPGKCRLAMSGLSGVDEAGTQRLAFTVKSPDSGQERRIEVRIRRYQPKRPPASGATTNRLGTGTFREIKKKDPKPLL